MWLKRRAEEVTVLTRVKISVLILFLLIGNIKIYYKDTLLEEDNIYLDRKINFNLISFIKQNNYVKYSLIIIFIGILIYLLKLYLNNRKNIININE